MPYPAYMWVKNSEGNEIKGSVPIAGKEGSIEIQEFRHELALPIDPITSKPQGLRRHKPITIIKEFDAASPYLYKACKDGETLQSIEIKWYQINKNGKETEYFNHLLESCRVTSVRALMHSTKESARKDTGHLEEVAISYDKITWTYVDGALSATDDWKGEQ